ncbi:MAG: hypothetical protein ACM3OO_05990 [Planctomycetaceae bacterium]
MGTALKVAVATLIGCGALLLGLGVAIWTGDGDGLIPLHVAIGVVLVLTLWTVCGIAARSGVSSGTVAFAAAWGVLVVVLGLIQEELVPGDLHWTIQVLHILVSMGAIWWGRRLAGLIARARLAGASGSMQRASATW